MISKNVKRVAIAIFTLAFCISLLPPQAVYAYVQNGYAYPRSMKSGITVYINPGLENIYSNVEGSTRQWAGLSGINFSRMYDFYNPALSQCYVDTDNGTYGVCYYTSSTFKEISYHIAFKNASTKEKAETVVHEVGHALGLAHTQSGYNTYSVMRAVGFNGKPYPLSDDKTGIRAIYGYK